MDSPKEFVENWNIIQTLGEGAFGEVKLLVHQVTNQAIAVKIIDCIKHSDAKESVKKEEKIHRLMVHPNILRLLGKRVEEDKVYIFLEYAAGGELFDKIEPDIGMPSRDAQKYMKQLFDGVSYMHSQGVVHRDIKPENLLLNNNDDLKISDFGMATIFRLRGRERMLDKRCGTLPYVAPEVLTKNYRAEPIDVWSCGIVFVAMLSGELPWDEPTDRCEEYLSWINEDYLLTTPWSKLENSAISLAKKILCPIPKMRSHIEQILRHPWMLKSFNDKDLYVHVSNKKHQRTTSGSLIDVDSPAITHSQPAPLLNDNAENIMKLLIQKPVKQTYAFSQPTQNENLLISTQLQSTQTTLTQNQMHKLIKRMTRFCVKTSYEETIKILCSQLEKFHYAYNNEFDNILTISTTDTRRMPLIFKTNFIQMEDKLMLDFRLSKGCGIEFKRKFMKIRNSLNYIIAN